MEIEAKFRVEGPGVFTTLMTLTRLGNYTLRPQAHVEQQHNTYYDTADGRLQAALYGLRTREVDGRYVVTLKGPNQASGGVHQRAEWEFETDNPDPSTWPDGEARSQALNLLGGAPLQPILTMRTTRRHIMVSHDDQVIAELSLDEGTFVAPAHTQGFCELEIELLPAGSHADLEAIVAALQEHTRLVPEERSKLERGLRLLGETGTAK